MADLLNKRVQFAKGLESNYLSKSGTFDAEEFGGVVYFATDSYKIYVDGIAYGIGGTVLETLKTNNFVSAVKLEDGNLVIEFYDTKGEKQTSTTALAKIESGADNAIKVEHKKIQVDKEGGESGEKETIETQDYIISLTIDNDDKVLSQTASGLKAELSLDYSNNTLSLIGKNGAVLSSKSLGDLTKDRFVQSGTIVTIDDSNTDAAQLEVGTVAIKLVLKTYSDEDGSETTTDVYIPAKSLVDTYIAGDGISFVTAGENETTSGSGQKIEIHIAEDGYLTVDENGLSIDKDSLSSDIVDDVKSGVTASDLSVSADDDRTVSEAISTLDSSVADINSAITTLQTADTTLSGRVDVLDSSVSGIETTLSALDGTQILVGGDADIEADSITTQTTLQEALNTLNSRLNAIAGTEGEVNWDNQTISTYLSNVMTATGLTETGEFNASVYNDTALSKYSTDADGKSTLKSVADAIKSLDTAMTELRVNDEKSVWDAQKNYYNITLSDTNIGISPSDFTGVLATELNVHSALNSIDQSITWKYYDTVSSNDEEVENEVPEEPETTE